MRGPSFRSPRNSGVKIPQTPPTTSTRAIGAPVGGWNARDPLASMKPTDAVVMDNFFPSTGSVDLRPGRIVWSSGIPGNVQGMLAYNSVSSNKLFAASNLGIYEVTNGGTVGGSVSTSTNGRWKYRNVVNAGGSWLVAVNGVDGLRRYDGTTWFTDAAGTGGTPAAVTAGFALTQLNNIHLHKRRLWFTRANSMSAYYLGIDAVGGALSEFPMGSVFRKGGFLVAQDSWTIDGGTGSDDYLVTVTSEGELAVYQGLDPSNATTFSLVGVYDVGRPLSRKCFRKYGGDLLYLSKQGVFPLSKLLLSATLERTSSISDKIDGAFKEAVASYRSVFGWELQIHPTFNAIVINVPQVETNRSVQFVMNNITKAWCRFTGWNCDTFEVFQDEMYSALGSVVYRNWTGTVDGGKPIQGRCQQAYLSIGTSQKIVQMVQPLISLQGKATIEVDIDTDFELFNGLNNASDLVFGSGVNLWGQGQWGSAVWSGGSTPINAGWLTVVNNPGYFHSFRLQCTSSTASLSWVSTSFALQGAGLL